MTDKPVVFEYPKDFGKRLFYEMAFLRRFAPDMEVRLQVEFEGRSYRLSIVLLGDDKDDYDR